MGFNASDKLNQYWQKAIKDKDQLFFINHCKPIGCILRESDNAFKTKRDALRTAQLLEKFCFAGGCFLAGKYGTCYDIQDLCIEVKKVN